MPTIAKLSELINEFRNERDWSQFHTPKDMVLSLMLEAGELAEIFQWKTESECSALASVDADPKIREALADEISDTLYWLLLLARDFNIDIEAAFANKMEKNRLKYPVEHCKGKAKKYDQYS
jgi:dCTP diphosphatase